jgi:hypothetical protein
MIAFAAGRRLPLVQGGVRDEELRARVRQASFAGVASPEGVRAGLLLYAGAWEDAHNVAQDLHTPEGSYWHAILHRQEPDAWNSGYWFRKVGRHPVYEQVREAAAALGYAAGAQWDPERFVEFCEKARTQPGSPAERMAIEVQFAEWQALFDWCARSLDSK